jgi:hypothetical protein
LDVFSKFVSSDESAVQVPMTALGFTVAIWRYREVEIREDGESWQ